MASMAFSADDDQRRLAVIARHQGDYTASDLFFQLVGHGLQILGWDVAEKPCGEIHTVDLAHLCPIGRLAGRQSVTEVGIVPFELAPLLDQLGDAHRQIARRRLQGRGRVVQQPLLLLDIIERGAATYRLDPSDPGRERALADDLEKPDIAGPRNMRTATEFGRVMPAPLERLFTAH
jgi:hypothetical protein